MSASGSGGGTSAAFTTRPATANARTRKSGSAPGAGVGRLKSAAAPKALTRSAKPEASLHEVSAATQRVQDVLEKDPLSEQILALRQEQDALRRQRKDLSKTLRLAEKKKNRLRNRAKALTDEDLIQVLMMRKEQRELAPTDAAASVGSGLDRRTSGDAAADSPEAPEVRDEGGGTCAGAE